MTFLLAEAVNANSIDLLVQQFEIAAQGWNATILRAALGLFWSLALISTVYSVGITIFQVGELAAGVLAMLRMVLYVGINYWVLLHGPEFAHAIIATFSQLGADAGGLGRDFQPTLFLDMSFTVYQKILQQEHWYQPAEALGAEINGILIVLCACWMTANIVLVLCSAWVLSSSGFVFLSFGASVWGQEMAVHFWRTVIATGARIMVMMLILSIGYGFLQRTLGIMTVNPNGGDLIVFMACSFVLALLSHSLPNLVGSIAGGHGAHGIGNLGLGVGLASAGAVGQLINNAVSTGVQAIRGAAVRQAVQEP